MVPGVVALHGGLPVGGAFGERHLSTGIVLLGYRRFGRPARSPYRRRLLSRATSAWSLPGTTAVLAEVEDPRHHKNVGHGDPMARRRFYARRERGSFRSTISAEPPAGIAQRHRDVATLVDA